MITNRPEALFLSVLQRTRGIESISLDDVIAGAVMLYCRRMSIVFRVHRMEPHHVTMGIDDAILSSDPVLSSFAFFFHSNRVTESFVELFNELRDVDDMEYEANYSLYVDSFFKLVSVFMGRRESLEYIQPRSVTEIIAFFMKKYGVKSLYNPFAGLCSYPISLGPNCTFSAQEINPTSLALAKVRLHAYGLNPDCLELDDSVQHWKGNDYDAIVASTPFGFRVPMDDISRGQSIKTTVEDLFFLRAMGRGDRGTTPNYPRKMVASIVPQSFCSRPASARLREMMCQDGSLDTVIELPEGIFPNTSIRTSIIILNPTEKHSTVRFINLTGCLKENTSKYRSLDWQKVISILESEDPDFTKTVSYDELCQQDYILNGDNYLPTSTKCPDGHTIVSLSELIERVPDSRIRYSLPTELLPVEAFSNKVLDILHPNTSLITRGLIDSGYTVSGPCILFIIKERQVLAYLHKAETAIAINRRVYGFRVISDKVSPEYMATLLLKDDIFCKQLIESTAWVSGNMSRALLFRSIVIAQEPLQQQYLKLHEAKEIEERDATDAAEKARYQISKAGSDIAHILATPFQRQNRIIRTLATLEPGSEKYVRRVTSLIDVCQYIRRMTIAIGGDLRTATFRPQDVAISHEVSDYVRAWGNFDNSTDYQVIIQDETKGDVHLNVDPIMLWIALDTLLENAYRHGFREGNYSVPEGNLVCIRLCPVLLDDKPFIQIAVMNNGLKAPDGYSIEDFKTRGNYVGDSGHTGLGGNHVYTVANRMGGFIAYRTEMNWPFIIDILLPVSGNCSTEFNTPYEEAFV